MTQYTLNLTNAEDKALSYVASSQEEWINNAVKERCRISIDEIAQIAVDKCFENNIQVPSSKDDLVILAFDQGWVIPAVDRSPEAVPME